MPALPARWTTLLAQCGSPAHKRGPRLPALQLLGVGPVATTPRAKSMSPCAATCKLCSLAEPHSDRASRWSTVVQSSCVCGLEPVRLRVSAVAAVDAAPTIRNSSGGAPCGPHVHGRGGAGGRSPRPRACMVVWAQASHCSPSSAVALQVQLAGVAHAVSVCVRGGGDDESRNANEAARTGGGVRCRPRMRSCSASDRTPAGRAKRSCSSG